MIQKFYMNIYNFIILYLYCNVKIILVR